jgi:hypothetical protein
MWKRGARLGTLAATAGPLQNRHSSRKLRSWLNNSLVLLLLVPLLLLLLLLPLLLQHNFCSFEV